MNGEKFNLDLDLEKVKTIIHTSCVAVFTIVASVCLIMFARSSSKLMDRCGTKFEQIEDNLVKISKNGVKISEESVKSSESMAKLVGNWVSEAPPNKGTNGFYFNEILKSLAKLTSNWVSDDLPNEGTNGFYLNETLKNTADITQATKEKIVGDKGNKGLLNNAYEICERMNNGLKSVHESHIITAKFDTRTNKEKSDEESRGGIIESDNGAFRAGADLQGEYNENSSLLDRFVAWVFCHPV